MNLEEVEKERERVLKEKENICKSTFLSDITHEGAICSTISTKNSHYIVTRTILSRCVIAKFTIYYQVYPYR